MMVSDCCGAEAGDALDVGICPECKEHCEFIDDGCDGEEILADPREMGQVSDRGLP